MAQDVDGHSPKPQHEARFVDQEQVTAQPGAGEQQGDAAGEQARRQYHQEGAEDTQQQGWGALAPVSGGARVIADEPVAGGPDLEQHGWDQEHADEHVSAEERPDAQHGYPFGSQEDQQHRRHGPCQTGIGLDPCRPVGCGPGRLDEAAPGARCTGGTAT